MCVSVGGHPQKSRSAFSRKESVFSEFWAGTKPLMFSIEIEVLQEICKEPELRSLASLHSSQNTRGVGGGVQLRGGRGQCRVFSCISFRTFSTLAQVSKIKIIL